MRLYHNAILIIMLLLAIPMVTRAQYDVVFSHYADMQSSFNPAAIGKDPKLNINAATPLLSNTLLA